MEKELRKLRGSEMTMIFQDPMTSLNPVLTSASRSQRRSARTTGHRRGEAERRVVDL